MAKPATADEKRRQSTKALLKLAERDALGKLKVFLGMAPGVGKTYAMLSAARALIAEGTDVVVGIVETHGRSETAALLEGLEVLPRKPVTYRTGTLMEFDIEAAIARKPKLLLVDEFAHTNAPDQMHAKRYQDVVEILRNGIDVWTTLNIQHLESLTDVVQRITGIRVQETVPDRMLEKADEIVIVDLPPEDLIQRLKEGKVYLPENARRAIDQFFKPSNLTALRELALRRTADRVDEQMLAQLRLEGIEGPWPTAERLLVLVGSDTLSDAVVRTAGRMATAQKAEWVALHVKQSDREATDRAKLRRTEKLLRLAERLGASTARLNAADLVTEILDYAKRNNITQIVVGRSAASAINRWRGRSLSQELVRRARGLSIVVVAPETAPPRAAWLQLPAVGATTSGLLVALVAVSGAVIAGFGLERLTPLPNLSIIFLLAVLLCATSFGPWSAIAASVLSFLSFNFFFIEPRYTFTVAEPQELLALMIFLVVAIVTGTMAGRLREQATATRDRAEATQALFDFSRKLSGIGTIDDVIWLLASQSATAAKGRSIILMNEGNGLAIKGGWPPSDDMATSDWAAARWAFERAERSGRGTATLPQTQFQFRLISGSQGAIGVLGIETSDADGDLPAAVEAMLQSFVEQAAIAIERTSLAAQATQAQMALEGDKLRAALLSSISHDLRTPLASIVGSVTSLRTLGERMSPSDRSELLATIDEEAGRMSLFVANLLDMMRLEVGAIDVRRDWVDVSDAIDGAVARAAKNFPAGKIETAVADNLPLVLGDAVLLEQVLFNLLDNAQKYSDRQSETRVEATADAGWVEIAVVDQGIGIPADALSKVFDKFYRVGATDGRAPGTGLGLSICAGFIDAMGGKITAESPVDGGHGTRMTIMLPCFGDDASRRRRPQEPT